MSLTVPDSIVISLLLSPVHSESGLESDYGLIKLYCDIDCIL